MQDLLDRLKTALADRYKLERHSGVNNRGQERTVVSQKCKLSLQFRGFLACSPGACVGHLATSARADWAKVAVCDKRRYMVVPNQREAEITISKVIEELVQLNEGHTYTYDRASLIAMLDEALAVSGR